MLLICLFIRMASITTTCNRSILMVTQNVLAVHSLSTQWLGHYHEKAALTT